MLKLTDKGNIASQVYPRLNLAEEDLEIAKDIILVNASGKLLQLRVEMFGEVSTTEPLFTEGLSHDNPDLFCFKVATESA